jgi:natural product precursor
MNKINLFKLNEIQLDKKQQQLIFGGNACKCGSCGGSTTTYANTQANFQSDITGTGTANPACMCSNTALNPNLAESTQSA